MAFALGLFAACASSAQAQTPTPMPVPCATPPPTPPACPTAAPHGLKLLVTWKNKSPVARKPFYLSPCPFNLAAMQTARTAPSRKIYYARKASQKLIDWLDRNNCDTVYCRPLEAPEVTCKPDANDPKNSCVPEFVDAYNKALAELKDKELARKWITNYEPLSKPELRTGFYEMKRDWLNKTVGDIEGATKLKDGTTLKRGAIRNATTDKDGLIYFYDLCPGKYYVSNIAPAEIGSDRIVWETTAISIEESETLTQKFLSDKKSNSYTITLIP
jgi:hypothetical protein